MSVPGTHRMKKLRRAEGPAPAFMSGLSPWICSPRRW